MGLDLTKPEDNMKFPTFPTYLRGVWKQNIDPAYTIYSLTLSVSGNLVVGANKAIEVPIAADNTRKPEIVSARARVKTAPTGADILVDINKNGVSIFANAAGRVTIPAGSKDSEDALVTNVSLTHGDLLTLDVDQIGSGTVGADLTVTLKVKQKVIFA